MRAMANFYIAPTSNIASTVLICLTGILVAGATVASTSMAQLGVPHEFIGIASALLITARTVGGSVATAVYSVILQNDIKDKGTHSIAIALFEAGLPLPTVPDVLTALLAGDPTGPALASAAKTNPLAVFAGVIALKKAYSKAFRLVYFVSIAFGVCGTICAAFSLNVAHLMTRHVDVTLDEGAHFEDN
jgi:Fungal trichothecene efflux pump (TRI12)